MRAPFMFAGLSVAWWVWSCRRQPASGTSKQRPTTRIVPLRTVPPTFFVPCSLFSDSMNAAVNTSPIRRAERFSVRLACGSFRNPWPELDRLGGFYAAKLCLAVREHRILGQRFAIPQHHDSLDRFAPSVVRNSDHGALVDLRQRHDSGFDLRAINVKAASDDHVFLAVDDVDVSVFVGIADVARVVPAVRSYLRRRLGQIVVASRDQGAARHDFAAGMGRKDISSVTHDREMHGG